MLYDILKFLKHNIWKPLYNFIYFIPLEKQKTKFYKDNFEMLKSMINVQDIKPATGTLRNIQLNNLNFAKEILSELEENNINAFMMYGTLLGAARHGGFIPWDDDLDFGMLREDYEKTKAFAQEKYMLVYRKTNRICPQKSVVEFKKMLLEKYPNKIIFLLSKHLLKVIKGTCLSDCKQFDLFVFDYYANDYKYDKFIKKSHKLLKKMYSFNDSIKEMEYLKQERLKDANIVKRSSKIFYGIDNMDLNYYSLAKYTDFMKSSDFYPLKKMEFEDTKFWAPNNHIKILEDYFGNDWMEIPNNILPPHMYER